MSPLQGQFLIKIPGLRDLYHHFLNQNHLPLLSKNQVMDLKTPRGIGSQNSFTAEEGRKKVEFLQILAWNFQMKVRKSI